MSFHPPLQAAAQGREGGFTIPLGAFPCTSPLPNRALETDRTSSVLGLGFFFFPSSKAGRAREVWWGKAPGGRGELAPC